ncbi:MAG: hypothetical protein K9G62_03715 [Alphaproteobacteria bacterium]|nr:hypothetical protein [Alphaproteobacteria bacterium]
MGDIQKLSPESKPDSAQLIYVLYLASLVLGVTAVIGVIWAYMEKGRAPAWLMTHYTWLIHTFWKGLMYLFIGVFTSVIFIGFILIPLTAIWFIVRCIKGLQLLGRREAIPKPESWLF